MNKKISLGTTLALLLVAVTLTVSVTMVIAMKRFSSTVTEVNKRQAMYDYLTEIDKSVRQNYTGTIDEEKLREALAASYMSNIGDQYAAYYTASSYAAIVEELSGKDSGFGVELKTQSITSPGEDSQTTDMIFLSRIAPGSPAEKAGLRVGDALIGVDGEDVTPLQLSAIRRKLEKGGKILLTVTREGTNQSFSLTSSTYTLVSVDSTMLENQIGYIRIRSFNDATASQFTQAYDQLRAAGATAFVFDLRGNSGGSYQAAAQVIGNLTPRGQFATLTKGSGETVALSTENSYSLTVPSVTLVNAATAGEAELFAGVLQEQNLTTVVGVATAGRALVQEYFTITSDNAAIKLSTGELSLLHSGSWEGVGIVPNREVVQPSSQAGNLDIVDPAQDDQLQAAVTLLSGNTGGETTTTPPSETTTTPSTDATGETDPTDAEAPGEETSTPEA